MILLLEATKIKKKQRRMEFLCSAEKPIMSALVILALLLLHLPTGHTLDLGAIRQIATKNNATALLVFGDSTVDPGNNDHLLTTFKCNFPPYGSSFSPQRPTGRCTNGRLPTDIIASDLGISGLIPGFLDPSLNKEQLLHGASFASASSGYDELTANITNVLSISKQIEYLMHYKIHLRQLVGQLRADEIVTNAVFVISAGSNDFLQNYYVEPTRAKQFKVEAYIDFLMSRVTDYLKAMHRQGGRRFAVVGVPPFGCLPLIRTLAGETKKCSQDYNRVASMFNTKLQTTLVGLRKALGIKTAYVNAYGSMLDAFNSPGKYGFTVTTKGCCGTGIYEYGTTCKDQNACSESVRYMYWDALHPTEALYKLIVDTALPSVSRDLFLG